jgi:acetoin utilization protein AcuB
MRVKTIARPPLTVDTRTTLPEATAIMRRHGIRHLLVTDGTAVAGVLAEIELRRAGRSSIPALARHEWMAGLERVTAGELMIPARAIAADASIADAARLAADAAAAVLPVIEDGCLVGMISRNDLLDVLIGILEADGPARLQRILVRPPAAAPERVVAVARGLADRDNATLIAAAVLSLPPEILDIPMASGVIDDVIQSRRAGARAWLRSLPGLHDAPCEVGEGHAGARLGEVAVRRSVDLVVVEAREAAALMATAPCPVLAVPDR